MDISLVFVKSKKKRSSPNNLPSRVRGPQVGIVCNLHVVERGGRIKVGRGGETHCRPFWHVSFVIMFVFVYLYVGNSKLERNGRRPDSVNHDRVHLLIAKSSALLFDLVRLSSNYRARIEPTMTRDNSSCRPAREFFFGGGDNKIDCSDVGQEWREGDTFTVRDFVCF